MYESQQSRGGGGGCIRLAIVLAIALFGIIRYFASTSVNPVTGQKQHVGGFTPDKEIALGLEAAPAMIQQYGGESDDMVATGRVKHLGQSIVEKTEAKNSPYKFEFHLLDDPDTINAFALPGGQVFITEGLYKKLKNDSQLVGVLGHEIGHVIQRHSAQQMAKAQLTQTISTAAVIGTYDPNDRNSIGRTQLVALVGQMISLKYGRNDELEADKKGVEYMQDCGYNPFDMIEVMNILKQAGGGGRQPEFFSTHPNPDNRIEKIKQDIQELGQRAKSN